MNYRHIYHAGNFADVIKHLVLIHILEHLKQKEAPFFVLDTHAGIGLYDLESTSSQKTQEAQKGVMSLWEKLSEHSLLACYKECITGVNPEGGLRYYPGSPAITSALIRRQDRFLANELHPEDYATLREVASASPHRFKVLHMDGYQALRANLPPKERRGVVLIDPPFEEKDEFITLAEQLKEALKRWGNGTFMMWFPLKAHLPIQDFYDEVQALGAPKTLLIETWIHPRNTADTLTGCGVLVVNAPWKLDTTLAEIRPLLEKALCPSGTSGIVIKWLNP